MMTSLCSLPEVNCPPMQSWQILMFCLIGWAATMSLVGLMIDTYRRRIHEMPRGIPALAALMLLSHHPAGLMLQMMVYLAFYSLAPVGASLVVTAFGLFGLWGFWSPIIGKRHT